MNYLVEQDHLTKMEAEKYFFLYIMLPVKNAATKRDERLFSRLK
jgi:hypothetical protein